MEALLKYTAPADLLADRVVLITGAAGGIGRAAALAYAEHGATVVLCDRKQAKLERVYDEIESSDWPQPALMPLDLAKATSENYQQVAQKISQEFGRLDGILHNAAELGVLAPLELYDLGVWGEVMQVNLIAPFLLTRACLGLLRQSQDASVVFTSADVARAARPYWGAYGVCGFAVEGLMQTFAAELAGSTSIRVNSLDPGPVRTALRARAYPGEDPAALPLPESVIPAYLYLMGPDSHGTTGQAFAAHQE